MTDTERAATIRLADQWETAADNLDDSIADHGGSRAGAVTDPSHRAMKRV